MNKKGFAISIILYSMVFLLISIFYLLLGIVKTRYTVTSNLRNDLLEKLNESNTLYEKIIKLCKNENIDYVEKYNMDNGIPIDTPDGSGDKEVCYYTSKDVENLAGKNGNVIFGDYCWQIVRTTADGGVKLIYNGPKTSDNKCPNDNSLRPTSIGVVGTEDEQDVTLSGDKLYGSKFEIYDDNGTNKFRLLNTNTYNWSDSSYRNIIGKYTCLSTNNTCTSIYYVGNYRNNTEAYTEKYSIGANVNFSQIGTSVFNVIQNSPSLVGYMFNDVYNNKSRGSIHESIKMINMDSTNSNTAYYYGDKAIWNTTTQMYDLTIDNGNGNDITPSSTIQWSTIRNNAKGMYTCRSGTLTSCADVYYIVANVTGTYMYSLKLSNNETKDKTVTWTYGKSYTKNGSSYELTNPATMTISLKDWYTKYFDYMFKSYYLCSDLTSVVCDELYNTGPSSNHELTYNKSSNGIYFGNSVTYSNGSYTIDTDDDTTKYQQLWDWYGSYYKIKNSHYTCFNINDNTCGDSIYYVYYTDSSYAKYIELKNGDTVESALKKMLNYKQNTYESDANINFYNSSIKGIVDNFYETKLSNTDKMFLDSSSVFCNDRAITNLGGWNATGGGTNSEIVFTQKDYNQSLNCLNMTDRFSKENEKANLIYPIGLLSEPERGLMNQYYAKTGQPYWSISPNKWYGSIVIIHGNFRYSDETGGTKVDLLNKSYGVRPVVVLKSGVEVKGTGTYDDPYIVLMSN